MDLDVENVLIYVDDAVREDAVVDRLSSYGPTYRTVAASTHTPTSFGSILTGLLPPHSNILSFKHVVPEDVRSVFDLASHVTSIGSKGGMNQSIAEMFGDPPRRTISELTPPFVHVERRPGGHTPYNGFDWDTLEFEGENGAEYFDRIARDPDTARADYREGVARSVDEFERVLDELANRGLDEDTLVVYTSDHGELLGEYGFFGHTHLATPEVVYVPTTFVHPSLSPGRRDGLLHHVDLVPTVADALEADVDVGRTDGTVEGRGRTTGYNHLEHVRYGTLPKPLEALVSRIGGFERILRSLWDAEGGHVFVEGTRAATSLVYLGLLTQRPFGKQVRHAGRTRDAYRRFTPGHETYGSPGFGEREARSVVESKLTERSVENEVRIDRQTVEQLEGMGYL